MIAPWPEAEALAHYIDADAERAIALVIDTVSSVRAIRARHGISPKKPMDISIKVEAPDAALLEQQRQLVVDMANLSSCVISPDVQKPDQSSVALIVGGEVYVALSGLVDFDAERARLSKQEKELERDVAKLDKKLSNPGYLAKAKPEVIAKDRAKFEEASEKLRLTRARLEELA